jgi:hypothetical protein
MEKAGQAIMTGSAAVEVLQRLLEVGRVVAGVPPPAAANDALE